MSARPAAGDNIPFLFAGLLCWLCGAVVLGMAALLLFGWMAAAAATAALAAAVLAVCWSLGEAAKGAGSKGGTM